MPESPPGRIQRQILTRPHGRARDVTRPVHQYAGAGTAKNPKRPQYSDLAGLTGFTAELSDDGRFALVEFVAKESHFLTTVANSGQRLERKDSPNKDALLEEFKRYKRHFKPDRFGLAIP